jgi:hypothetical protein
MSWMPDLSADGENEVVEQAVAEMPALLDEIATALGTGDLETAADRAHYLKNTVFALRIEPMIAPCRAVFERASSGDADAARHALADLRGALSVWLGQRTGRGVS